MTTTADPVQPAPRVSDEPREWLIRKGACFYRPGWCGYTFRKDEAGRYTEAEARKEAELEPWHMAAVHQDSIPNSSPPPTPYDVALARITALETENTRLKTHRIIDKTVNLGDDYYATQEGYDCLVKQNNEYGLFFELLLDRVPELNDQLSLLAIADWIATNNAENARLREDMATAKRDSISNDVMSLFKDHNTVSVSMAKECVNASAKQVFNAFGGLHRRGLIKKVAYGQYIRALTPPVGAQGGSDG